jgi:hypothetical protein
MKQAPLSLLALLSFASAGCSAVKVNPTGADVGAAPRPADCAIEFLFQAPSRPYDALAELQSHVTNVPPGGAWLVLGPKACELGADAVIVTRTQTLNLLDHMMVEGTAIVFRRPGLVAPAPVLGPNPAAAPDATPAPVPDPAPMPAPPPEVKPGS